LNHFRDMHAGERNYASRSAVSIYAPFRFLAAAAMALLIATLFASSSAHGMVLGDAVAQSTLGSPLRVVIPVSAAPDESLQPACFRLLPAVGDGSAQIVTARVSLERAAAASRLVVTTPNAVNDPAIRFSIQAGCEASTRRLYVLLLDPPAARASAATAGKQVTTLARELGQERTAPQSASARRSPDSAALSETLVVRVPVPAGRAVPALPAAAAATRAEPDGDGLDWSRFGSYLAAALAVAGVIALAALFARRRRASPEIPQWTRNPSYSGPRSFSDLSTAQATLSHTPSHAGATTTPTAPSSSMPKSVTKSPLTGGGSAPSSRSSQAAADPSAVDTLLNELDPDIVEERAVREAWAAARSDVEREMDANEILQAIEAAERDLLLAPPPPAQTAIEHALDDDLLRPPRRR
jgi:hypothetical protein